MLLISKILPGGDSTLLKDKVIEYFELEWYEATKRILRKKHCKELILLLSEILLSLLIMRIFFIWMILELY